MTWTSAASGDQACTVSTEHTLTTQTGNGTYVLALDLNACVNGDRFEVRLKTKVKTGATSRLAYFAVFEHAQGSPNVYSIPVPVDTEIVATLKQVAGTGRTVPWSLLSQ